MWRAREKAGGAGVWRLRVASLGVAQGDHWYPSGVIPAVLELKAL